MCSTICCFDGSISFGCDLLKKKLSISHEIFLRRIQVLPLSSPRFCCCCSCCFRCVLRNRNSKNSLVSEGIIHLMRKFRFYHFICSSVFVFIYRLTKGQFNEFEIMFVAFDKVFMISWCIDPTDTCLIFLYIFLGLLCKKHWIFYKKIFCDFWIFWLFFCNFLIFD